MKKRKHFAGEDRVLRFAVTMMIVLLMIGTVIVGLRMRNLRVDSSKGEEKLKELAERDVEEIDARIKKLEEEEEKVLEERKNRTNGEKFADCLILGDAICQGLYEYEYLDAGVVSSSGGLRVTVPDETGLTDMILQAVSDAPQHIFLVLGREDDAAEEDAETFVQAYEAMLIKLKEGLPDSQICVDGIVPVKPEDGRTSEYNKKLAELCENLQVVFIDNEAFMKNEYYEEDGVHMTAAFYSEWISCMAEQAKL